MSLKVINNFSTCVQNIDKKHFFIQDAQEQQPAFVVEKNGEFQVINNTSYPINFLKIDSCISNSSDTKRCDCAVYNDHTFCFIELKNSKRTNWKSHRKSAEEQLKATILDFSGTSITNNKILEAYMCCTCNIDGNFTKISRASNNYEIQTYFIDNLNTKLYCDTTKEFN